jgi:hypothetical protein
MFDYPRFVAGRRGGWSQLKRDRVLQAACHGEAWRRAQAGESIAGIVAEVRSLAGDRAGVLVEMAGVTVGSWSVKPSLPATELLVAGILLAAAGADDVDELNRWLEVGRERGSRPPHTAS